MSDPTDIMDRPLWHIRCDPYSARAYDWEEWASDDWRRAHWESAALRRVTDGE